MRRGFQIKRRSSIELDLLNLATGKRPRRLAALRLARAGLANVTTHDAPVTLTAKGREAIRQLSRRDGGRS